MREVNFRIWYKNPFGKSRFVKSQDVGVKYDLSSGKFSCNGLDVSKYYVLLEYTGINDKNGEPIYEGDIVRYNKAKYEVSYEYGGYILTRLDHEIIDYDDFPVSIFQVGSDVAKFCGSENDYCVSFYELADNQQDFEGNLDCEVVGNIYENPELKAEEL